ncbi:hypothetical protein ABW19_dt0206066 [Dactylella cylindrospora]|nr:hypothetical protein ABW19_dt0206066 [Dactylella cylindrospora]
MARSVLSSSVEIINLETCLTQQVLFYKSSDRNNSCNILIPHNRVAYPSPLSCKSTIPSRVNFTRKIRGQLVSCHGVVISNLTIALHSLRNCLETPRATCVRTPTARFCVGVWNHFGE